MEANDGKPADLVMIDDPGDLAEWLKSHRTMGFVHAKPDHVRTLDAFGGLVAAVTRAVADIDVMPLRDAFGLLTEHSVAIADDVPVVHFPEGCPTHPEWP